jgi:hypothetical protein
MRGPVIYCTLVGQHPTLFPHVNPVDDAARPGQRPIPLPKLRAGCSGALLREIAYGSQECPCRAFTLLSSKFLHWLPTERRSEEGNHRPYESQYCDHTAKMQEHVLRIEHHVREVQHEHTSIILLS